MDRRKKIYLGTNTKMYKTTAQTVAFLKRLNQLTKDISRDRMELFVIPSYPSLAAARKAFRDRAFPWARRTWRGKRRGSSPGRFLR